MTCWGIAPTGMACRSRLPRSAGWKLHPSVPCWWPAAMTICCGPRQLVHPASDHTFGQLHFAANLADADALLANHARHLQLERWVKGSAILGCVGCLVGHLFMFLVGEKAPDQSVHLNLTTTICSGVTLLTAPSATPSFRVPAFNCRTQLPKLAFGMPSIWHTCI